MLSTSKVNGRARGHRHVMPAVYPNVSRIARSYEAYGGKGHAKVSTYTKLFEWTDYRILPVQRVFKTNILEDEGDEIELVISHKDGKKFANMEVVVKPYEVTTLRLEI